MKHVLFHNCRLRDSRADTSVNFMKGILGSAYPRTSITKLSDVDHWSIHDSTVMSYARMSLDFAVFQFDFNSDYQIQSVSEILNRQFKCPLQISHTRPSTIEGWLDSLYKINAQMGDDVILYLSMNHDHPYVGGAPELFRKEVERSLTEFYDNQLIIYSHTPEMLQIAISSRSWGYTQSFLSSLRTCTESIVIGKIGTIIRHFQQVCSGVADSYMPRLDWIGLKYKKIRYRALVPLVEQFRHYDGYGHVSLAYGDSAIGPNWVNHPNSDQLSRLKWISSQWWYLYGYAIEKSLPFFFEVLFSRRIFKKLLNRTLENHIRAHCMYLEIDITDADVAIIHALILGKYVKAMAKISYSRRSDFFRTARSMLIKIVTMAGGRL